MDVFHGGKVSWHDVILIMSVEVTLSGVGPDLLKLNRASSSCPCTDSLAPPTLHEARHIALTCTSVSLGGREKDVLFLQF